MQTPGRLKSIATVTTILFGEFYFRFIAKYSSQYYCSEVRRNVLKYNTNVKSCKKLFISFILPESPENED